MKGAIMQPYFFPYIGYYQLAFEVEKYVFLDDVNFIKQGYINRNSILLQGRKHDFSIPVKNVSSFRKISEHEYNGDFSKFLKLIDSAYRKSPFFDKAMPLIESVVLDPDNNVARKNSKSLTAVFSYLGLNREFVFSSDVVLGGDFKGQERVIEICCRLGIDRYRNAIGGKTLYCNKDFDSCGVGLGFLSSNSVLYKQGNTDFVPCLSIIDVLMWCDKEEVLSMLKSYTIQ